MLTLRSFPESTVSLACIADPVSVKKKVEIIKQEEGQSDGMNRAIMNLSIERIARDRRI